MILLGIIEEDRDTNILVYAYDKSEHAKWLKASALIQKVLIGEVAYAPSLQDLAEFYVVVTRKIDNPLSHLQAKQTIQYIVDLPQWFILTPDMACFKEAIHFSAVYKLSLWDAYIIAVAIQHHIHTIVNLKFPSGKNALYSFY